MSAPTGRLDAVLVSRQGRASDIHLADGTIIEDILRSRQDPPEGDRVTLVDYAGKTATVDLADVVVVVDTITGLVVWAGP